MSLPISRVIPTELYLTLSSFSVEYDAPNDILRFIYGVYVELIDIPGLELKHDICKELSLLCTIPIGVDNKIIEFGSVEYYNGSYSVRNVWFNHSIPFNVIKLHMIFDSHAFYDCKKNRYHDKAYFEKQLSRRLDMILSNMFGNSCDAIVVERRIGLDGKILQSKKGSKKYIKRRNIQTLDRI